LSEEPLHHFLRLHPFYVKTNHAGGKILVAGCVKLDVRHLRESLFHLSVELVCPRRDPRWPNVLVKTNGLRQRPEMFECLKTAR